MGGRRDVATAAPGFALSETSSSTKSRSRAGGALAANHTAADGDRSHGWMRSGVGTEAGCMGAARGFAEVAGGGSI